MRVWMREERQRRPHTQKASHRWNKSGGWLVTSVMQHADIFIIRPPVGGICRFPVRDLTPAVAQTIIYPHTPPPPPPPEYTFILGVRSDRWTLLRTPTPTRPEPFHIWRTATGVLLQHMPALTTAGPPHPRRCLLSARTAAETDMYPRLCVDVNEAAFDLCGGTRTAVTLLVLHSYWLSAPRL